MARKYSRRHMFKLASLATASLALPINPVEYLCRSAYNPDLDRPGNQSKKIRLCFNENPLGPGPSAVQAINQVVSKSYLYPWDLQQELVRALAEFHSLETSNFLLSAGSSPLLDLAGQIASGQSGNIISAYPTFVPTMIYAQRRGLEWRKIALSSDHQVNFNALSNAIDLETRCIYLCNPNNPTGLAIPASELIAFIESVPDNIDILLDEAYIEIAENQGTQSLVPEIRNYPNLVITRTFSKVYGLAGLRIGYAVAHEERIKTWKDYQIGRGMTTNMTSLAAAIAALGDNAFLEKSKNHIQSCKELIYDFFDQNDFSYVLSGTNFIWFRLSGNRENLPDRLSEEKNILVRKYSDQPGWCRVSIGLKEEVQQFIKATNSLI